MNFESLFPNFNLKYLQALFAEEMQWFPQDLLQISSRLTGVDPTKAKRKLDIFLAKFSLIMELNDYCNT